jgi:branched-chain amino acid transport system ATP-binding protein
MLAIGRALMANPSIVLADEISLGLAPIVIHEIYKVIKSINDKGVSVLVVEQQTTVTFKYTSYIYVMEQGKIALAGVPDDLSKNEYIINSYLGE